VKLVWIRFKTFLWQWEKPIQSWCHPLDSPKSGLAFERGPWGWPWGMEGRKQEWDVSPAIACGHTRGLEVEWPGAAVPYWARWSGLSTWPGWITGCRFPSRRRESCNWEEPWRGCTEAWLLTALTQFGVSALSLLQVTMCDLGKHQSFKDVQFVFLETGSLCVVQADFKLKILLPHPPECWDYRCVPRHPARCVTPSNMLEEWNDVSGISL
jgi:hypothetical protein